MGGIHDNQRGFTLVELLVVMGLVSVLLTLGAVAFRQYWFVHAVDSSTDEVVSQLRRVQARTMSESNPLVYGVKFRSGSSDWDVVRYDPGDASEDPPRPETCRYEDRNTLSGGAFSGGVVAVEPNFTVPADAPELVACQAQLTGVQASDEFVFFYARGTATPGSVKLRHPALGAPRDQTVSVTRLTGRTTRS